MLVKCNTTGSSLFGDSEIIGFAELLYHAVQNAQETFRWGWHVHGTGSTGIFTRHVTSFVYSTLAASTLRYVLPVL